MRVTYSSYPPVFFYFGDSLYFIALIQPIMTVATEVLMRERNMENCLLRLLKRMTMIYTKWWILLACKISHISFHIICSLFIAISSFQCTKAYHYQEGWGHWAVYYTRPPSFIMTFSFSLVQHL